MDLGLAIKLFINSFLSSFIWPLESEIIWFSLLSFEAYSMLLPSCIAILASSLSILCVYAIGWIIALDRANMPLAAENYTHAARVTQRYIIWLFLVPWLPLLPVIALAMGFLRINLLLFCTVVVLGRVLFYSYYLYV